MQEGRGRIDGMDEGSKCNVQKEKPHTHEEQTALWSGFTRLMETTGNGRCN